MAITKKENDEAIRKLEKGIDRAYDLFTNGGPGIKPGAVETYGAICGMKEVLAKRKNLAKDLENSSEMGGE